MMGTLFGGGENFDLNVARILKKREHNVRLIIGKTYTRLTLIPQDVFLFDTKFIPFIYLAWIADKVEFNSKLRWLISSLAITIDRRNFEIMAYLWLKNDNWSDVYQICGRNFLGMWLDKKHPAIVWWPGYPSRTETRYLNSYSFNLAGGDVFHQMKNRCKNLHRIEMCVDTDFFKPHPTLAQSDTVNFLFVGRLIKAKNLPILIRAFDEASKEAPNIRLHIVGDGQEKKGLIDLVSELRLNDRVKFYGHLYKDALLKVYQSSNVFVLCSTNETYFPTVLIEAMSCGLPFIATNVGGIKHMSSLNGKSGFIIEPWDINLLKTKILFFARNRLKMQEMSEYARNYAVENFSWERTVTLIEELFYEALKIRYNRNKT